jgi:hypothetical protein
MLGLGWLTLRQAQEALQHGRLEEALSLLRQPEVHGHKGAAPLLKEVAQGFVKRGEQQLRHDNISAAWNDLLQAEKVGGTDTGVERLRQTLPRLGLGEARKLLEAGEPGRAAEAIARLPRGTNPPAEVQLVEEAAKGWNLARDLAGRGEFALARETVERIRRLLPQPLASLERFWAELRERKPVFSELLLKLHEAVQQQRWRDVVCLAEQMLALAPQHAEARKARARAWKAIEPAPKGIAAGTDEPIPSRRFLLWIDGAGGYLVCLSPRVTIGQAAPDAFVDVPVLADVARTHASVTRDAEGYLLEAVRSVQVNGQPTDRALLQPGDRITLGTGCQFQFRQPVPVSATARLDLVSSHRLPLTLDGVILMADTLVLGPGSQAHVTIADLEEPVILFRQKDSLAVRHGGTLIVDGESYRDRAVLGETSKVRGEDFAFAVETVGARLGPTGT